ncbi:MAG: hypothetical protein HOQ05_00980 [Corynebacteriales bacterium]|nr:hypothetical protein [Mycobacteriales bacterium]
MSGSQKFITRFRRPLAVAAAVAGTLAVWVIGDPLLGHELIVQQPEKEAMNLGASELGFIALMAGLFGWAGIAVLERMTRHARLIWTIAAFLVLAVSFLPFIGLEATTGTKVVLALTHFAVGAALIPAFRKTSIEKADIRAEAPIAA